MLLNGFDDSQRGWALAQPSQELVDVTAVALELDHGARTVVAHHAGKAKRHRRRVDERAEADALNDAADADLTPATFHDESSSLPRPISSRPAIAASAPALSVFSTTTPMWMITQSPGPKVSSGIMPMLTLRCSPATSTSATWSP